MIKRLNAILGTMFVAVAAMSINAATPKVIELWPDGAPTSNGIAADKEENSNLDWITYVSEPTLTVYPADNPNGTALVMCPGGGYFGLSTKHEGSDMAADLNKAGVTLAVLKYRVPNGHHEIPLDDARQAVRLLRRHAGEFGIDPDRIGIGGASAGAHLAASLATHPADEDARVSFQVMVYPVVTMREGVTHQGSRENLLGKKPSKKLVEYYSNEKQVNAQTPPAFIAVATDDDVVPMQNSMDYFNALIANKVPVTLHVYPSGGHGWAYRQEFAYQQQWVDELLHWFAQLFSGK